MIKLNHPPRFRDIPQFNLHVAYSVDVSWSFLPKWLKQEFEDGHLDMDPDFQRGHVWTLEKQSAFVEFMLRGGDSSRNIYFNCAGYMQPSESTEYVLVDGKQRLTAVTKFLDNQVPVFNGYYFNDFQDRPTSLRFRININNLETRAEVLQWYIDLNTGGVVHSKEEIDRVKLLLEEELNKGKS